MCYFKDLIIRGALLAIDEVGDLEVQGEVGFEVLGIAGLYCNYSCQREALKSDVAVAYI